MPCDESWIYCYDPETKRQSSQWKMLALPHPRRLDRANPPSNFWWSLFLTALAWSTCAGFLLDWQSTRNTMLRFWGSSGRDFMGRGQHSSNRVSGIFTWTMHQSTTSSLSQTIWPRWASRQFLSLLISPDLFPCEFWLFPKLRGCRYETIEEMKEAVTKVIDTLTQEDFHEAFQKLLERYNKCIAARGDYFEGD